MGLPIWPRSSWLTVGVHDSLGERGRPLRPGVDSQEHVEGAGIEPDVVDGKPSHGRTWPPPHASGPLHSR